MKILMEIVNLVALNVPLVPILIPVLSVTIIL